MLKKIFILLIACVMLLPFSINCKKEEVLVNRYELDLIIKDNCVDGRCVYTVYNNETEDLYDVEFNLYPNAYAENSKYLPISESERESAYPHGLNYGKIEIKSVKNGEDNLEYDITEDGMTMKVMTDKTEPNKSTEIAVEFSVTVPESKLRLGIDGGYYNLGDLFPVICKRQNGEYITCKYQEYGDPYYSDCADYYVNITVPSKCVIACSGTPTCTEIDGTDTKYSYELKKGRDFGIYLSENYEVNRIKCEVADLYVYCDKEELEEITELCKNCLIYFNGIYGEYPYNTLSVAVTPFAFGGMEYSGLAVVSKDLLGDEKKIAIIHEIAHEWWHAGVGNDQLSNAYIDEGLAEYSTYLYLKHNGEEDLAEKIYEDKKATYKSFYTVEKTLSGEVNTTMNRYLGDYSSKYEYVNICYNKSMIMFKGYADAIGEEKAVKNLSKLYNKNLYGTIGYEEITKTLGVKEYFKSFVEGKVLI